MTTKITVSNIKQTLLGIFLGGLVSILPFYFETKALTLENSSANVEQDTKIGVLTESYHSLDRDLSVEKNQTENTKESLQRIEKKLDELIREVKSTN